MLRNPGVRLSAAGKPCHVSRRSVWNTDFYTERTAFKAIYAVRGIRVNMSLLG
jgi:hypothetical protein